MHEAIWERLEFYLQNNRIPNIIFHGEHGSGKKHIVKEFIDRIYGHDKEKLKKQVMFVNCAIGKGIKFVREDLKYFAKTHTEQGVRFKSIVFLNTDNLTMDAQSALRRCIELYSNNTRFFIVIEKICNLMKPIISRFCDIHVPKLFSKPIDKVSMTNCLNMIEKSKHNTFDHLIQLTKKLYADGYSALDVIECYKQSNEELVFAFSQWKKEFRNEQFLIILILNFIFLDKNCNNMLEPISFM